MPRQRILIAYDGSERAQRAIRAAAAWLAGAEAVVLHVAPLPTPAAPAVGLPGGPAVGDPVPPGPSPDEVEQLARRLADEGVQVAVAGGLSATARAIATGDARQIPETIVAVADECDAGLIVLGSHGHGPLRAALLGSVSAGVLSHTDRPVLVVPQTD